MSQIQVFNFFTVNLVAFWLRGAATSENVAGAINSVVAGIGREDVTGAAVLGSGSVHGSTSTLNGSTVELPVGAKRFAASGVSITRVNVGIDASIFSQATSSLMHFPYLWGQAVKLSANYIKATVTVCNTAGIVLIGVNLVGSRCYSAVVQC